MIVWNSAMRKLFKLTIRKVFCVCFLVQSFSLLCAYNITRIHIPTIPTEPEGVSFKQCSMFDGKILVFDCVSNPNTTSEFSEFIEKNIRGFSEMRQTSIGSRLINETIDMLTTAQPLVIFPTDFIVKFYSVTGNNFNDTIRGIPAIRERFSPELFENDIEFAFNTLVGQNAQESKFVHDKSDYCKHMILLDFNQKGDIYCFKKKSVYCPFRKRVPIYATPLRESPESIFIFHELDHCRHYMKCSLNPHAKNNTYNTSVRDRDVVIRSTINEINRSSLHISIIRGDGANENAMVVNAEEELQLTGKTFVKNAATETTDDINENAYRLELGLPIRFPYSVDSSQSYFISKDNALRVLRVSGSALYKSILCSTPSRTGYSGLSSFFIGLKGL